MSNNNIWIGEKDLTKDEKFIEIASQEVSGVTLEQMEDAGEHLEANRRDFLKFLGFGLGAATLAASCDIPVKRALPYVTKPDSIVPGVANYYASSYVQGGDYCPILVKTREGRPIKIEGNSLSKMTGGGTSARAQASVLTLYDTNRYKNPMIAGDGSFSATDWNTLDKNVVDTLSKARGIRIVSNTIMSPSTKKSISEFQTRYPSTRVYTYDPVSAAAMLEANEISFGDRVIPSYHFDKADVILSFGADFLGTWISPIEYSQQYIKNRKVNPDNPKMSRHIQVESHMSMTGSNADNRILVKPSEQGAAIAYLASKFVGGSGPALNDRAKTQLDKVAEELRSSSGKSLVVSNSNNVHEQILINAINNALGNVGTTVNFGNASLQRQGSERDLSVLISQLEGGLVDVVIFNDCNPVFEYYDGAKLKAALGSTFNIGLGYVPHETNAICNVIAPIHHSLESWGDVEPKRGTVSMIQPAIAPLFNTRQKELSLLTWAQSKNINVDSDQPFYDYLKSQLQSGAFSSQGEFLGFQSYWDKALQDGIVESGATGGGASFSGDVSSAFRKVTQPSNSELEISFYEKVSIGNGQFGHNPWLQEMPDPVDRTSWGNYLAVPVGFDGVKRFFGLDQATDLQDGDLVELTIGSKTLTVPVVQQFGQMPGTLAIAMGYGREFSGACANGIGVNVNDCFTIDNNLTQYYNTNVGISGKVGRDKEFSCVQYHNTYGVTVEDENGNKFNADEATLGQTAYGVGVQGYQGSLTNRSVMYTTSLNNLDKSIKDLTKKRHDAQHLNDQTLYPFDEYTENKYSQGHHWGMHVDLNACTGCNACTVACMAENNVPVVGKREVSRHHEMTWLRIDRYYYGDVENPNTVYQPLMCQHCDNAPCENVCPVNATNHSSEGLNQMIYNRCVGTRYCANNCPYKVRRFNWYDYTTADLFPGNQVTINGEEVPFGADNLTRMVLNPDVTVRSRGVIEKCSFCAQRLQEGKLTAKKEGRSLQDSDVKTACQAACPTGAITFGDMNNKKSELAKKLDSKLNFISLEEVNVKSSVTYTMKVDNRDNSLDA